MRAVPQPSESLVNALSARVTEDGRQSRLHVYARFSFACAISVLMLGDLASFGGIGYAASRTVDVAKVAKRVVTPAKPKPAPVVVASPSHDQYKPEKVTICHRTGSVTRDDHRFPAPLFPRSPRRHDRALRRELRLAAQAAPAR